MKFLTVIAWIGLVFGLIAFVVRVRNCCRETHIWLQTEYGHAAFRSLILIILCAVWILTQ